MAELFNIEEQQDLEYTQSIRKEIIKLVFNGTSIPEDPDNKRLLMQALDGMDKQIMSKTKIKKDDQFNKSQQSISSIIANLLMATKLLPNTESLELPNDIIVNNLVPGMTDIGKIEIDAKDFMSD